MRFIIFFLLPFPCLANVMDLNEFMPTRLEDSSVTPEQEFDLQGSVRYEDKSESVMFWPNIRYGLMKRVQLEFAQEILEAPRLHERRSGTTMAGFQWHFNDQDDWVPSMALESKFHFPTGKSSEGIDPSVRLNLTYTLAGTLIDPVGQIHLNYEWDHNSVRQVHEKKTGNSLLLGYSHKIGTSSVLVGDFVSEKNVYSGQTSNEIELGWSREFLKNFFIGVGAGLDIRDGYFNSTLAIQKTF